MLSLTRLAQRKNGSSTSGYDRVIQISLWLAVFLLPIFFLPVTTDVLEINKALLFYLCVLVAGVAWLLKLVLKREGTFFRSSFDIPIALFLLFSVLATLFSLYTYRSLVGTSGYYSGSLVSTIFFIFFFYICIHTIRKEHLPRFLNAFLLSGAVLALFNFFQVFGFYLFPWDFAKAVGFNGATNSPATFAVYIALVGLVSFFRLLSFRHQGGHRQLERGLLGLLGVVSFFLLMVYDQNFGWYTLIAGLLLFIVMLTSTSRTYAPVVLMIPTIVLGLALVGIFINTQSMLKASLPGDVQLPFSSGLAIAKDGVVTNPLLGFGQETYNAVFARFRPVEFNDTALWSVRFLKSSNEWFQTLASVGILGLLAFAGILVVLVRLLVRGMKRLSADDGAWWQRLPLLVGSLILVLSTFVMPWNLLTSFLFWFFMSLSVVAFREKDPAPVSPRGNKNANASFGASLGFSLAVIVGIVFVYFAGRFWIADMKVAQANKAVAATENLETVRLQLTESIDLNPYESSTYFDLAQNLLVQAQVGAQKEDADTNQLRVLLAASVAAGQTGAEKFSRYAGSYEALSSLYQNIDALTGTTSDETKNAFTKAIDLEQKNPQLYMNLGQYYLLVAQQKTTQANEKDAENPDAALAAEATDALENAKKAFDEAAKLKTNFVDAQLNIALVRRLLGDKEGSVTLLEDVAGKNPFNTDALFNLAENYSIDERTDDALAVLLRIVEIFPGHSDAHFRLAGIYEARNEIDKAIAELDKVAKINPENENVKAKLDELKAKQ